MVQAMGGGQVIFGQVVWAVVSLFWEKVTPMKKMDCEEEEQYTIN